MTTVDPRSTEPAAGPVAEPLALRPLTLIEDGSDVVLGDPATGTFVAIPPVGAVVIRALQAGATVEQAAAEAHRHADEPVDVASFVDALRQLGFLDTHTPAQLERTAPIQQQHWLPAVAAGLAGHLFGPLAWTGYLTAALFSAATLVLRPHLWPPPAEIGRNGLILIPALLLTYLLTAVHEAWHWLAARALGLSARFGIDRRLCFLVFETDLSQLWSVPRRLRYGPQLAGLAIDSVALAVLLALRISWPAAPSYAAGVLGTAIYLKTTTMLWQCMVHLRTDLYGVLVTALGCRNLWQVKSLMLRAAFGRLDNQQAAELTAADPRDRQIGRWFRWIYLIGTLVTIGYIGYFYVPAMPALARWTGHGLAAGPQDPQFWSTMAASALLYLPLLTTAGIWLTNVLRRARPGLSH